MKKVILLLILLSGQIFSQANTSSGPTLLAGHGEIPWGTSYEGVKERFISLAANPESDEEIAIVNEKKNESLLVKRNGIFYLYRFYKTPEIIKASRPKKEATPAEMAAEHEGEGTLFSIGIIFSYVDSKQIKEKLEAKYGKSLKESLDDKKISGARLWDLAKDNKGGFIVQWMDNYKKQAFTRRIDYFSSELKSMIDKEYKEFYETKEIKILKDLLL